MVFGEVEWFFVPHEVGIADVGVNDLAVDTLHFAVAVVLKVEVDVAH